MSEQPSSVTGRLREPPQSALYALSIGLYMSALYHSAPDVALQGAILSCWTAWYVNAETDQ